MIIVGYQGIGKSTLAGQLNCIDLESSHFYIDGTRPEDWYKIYVNQAIALSQQGYTVFISSHKQVRDYLKEVVTSEKVFCIFPSIQIKSEWIQKLQNRYNSTQSDKDLRALLNAEEHYVESIADLMTDNIKFIELRDSNKYNLSDIVSTLQQL